MTGCTAIIAAGGTGKRMGASFPKQIMELCGRPILYYALDQFEASPLIDSLVIVMEQSLLERSGDLGLTEKSYPKLVALVAGGETRTESVWRGLQAAPHCEIILVHDAVRPLLSQRLIEQAVSQAKLHGAAVPALALTDTIKHCGPDGYIISTVPRQEYVSVQTPQAFRRDILITAYRTALKRRMTETDDAALVEACGIRVFTFPGEAGNIKITYPRDLSLAEVLMQNKHMNESPSERG